MEEEAAMEAMVVALVSTVVAMDMVMEATEALEVIAKGNGIVLDTTTSITKTMMMIWQTVRLFFVICFFLFFFFFSFQLAPC